MALIWRWKRSRLLRHSSQQDTEPHCLESGMSGRIVTMDRQNRDLMNSSEFATDLSITLIIISFTGKAIMTCMKAPPRYSKTGSIFPILLLREHCSLLTKIGHRLFSCIWVSIFLTIRSKHLKNTPNSTRIYPCRGAPMPRLHQLQIITSDLF